MGPGRSTGRAASRRSVAPCRPGTSTEPAATTCNHPGRRRDELHALQDHAAQRPKFHVKLGAAGFVVWGITIKTPSVATNSVGTKLTPSSAHNTNGVDPGEAASNGFIVYNDISDGDDHIAIKGGTSVKNLTIAHNHFEAGHGMSIGSETNGGVSNVNVCDLSIDGTNTGLSGGSSNGIRIKSDSSRGGLVTNITYSDVCVRALTNPIIIRPSTRPTPDRSSRSTRTSPSRTSDR